MRFNVVVPDLPVAVQFARASPLGARPNPSSRLPRQSKESWTHQLPALKDKQNVLEALRGLVKALEAECEARL